LTFLIYLSWTILWPNYTRNFPQNLIISVRKEWEKLRKWKTIGFYL